MPLTVHLQLLDAFVTALSVASVQTIAGATHTKPTSLTVSRNYLRPKQAQKDVVVKPAETDRMALQVEPGAMGLNRNEFLVDAEIRLSTTDDRPEDATDEVVLWAHVAVEAAARNNGTPLGALVTGLDVVAVDWSGKLGASNEVRAVVRFRAEYFTAMDDPSRSTP